MPNDNYHAMIADFHLLLQRLPESEEKQPIQDAFATLRLVCDGMFSEAKKADVKSDDILVVDASAVVMVSAEPRSVTDPPGRQNHQGYNADPSLSQERGSSRKQVGKMVQRQPSHDNPPPVEPRPGEIARKPSRTFAAARNITYADEAIVVIRKGMPKFPFVMRAWAGEFGGVPKKQRHASPHHYNSLVRICHVPGGSKCPRRLPRYLSWPWLDGGQGFRDSVVVVPSFQLVSGTSPALETS